MNPAVVLLSGGLDSATVLACAQHEGYEIYALTFAYGQRHDTEVRAACRVAEAARVMEHHIINLDPFLFRGSALIDSSLDVPHHHSADDIGAGIPSTYVPARNTLFLANALAWAESIGAHDICIGVNALDYSGYPDCRPEFIQAFERAANLGTRAADGGQPYTIRTPLINLTKAQIIRMGLDLGVDYALTHSCYEPADDRPCGTCDACLLRTKGFSELGMTDPALALAR